MSDTSKVARLPLTRARATKIVREIVEDSQRWAITVPYTHNQNWRELVNRRQIQFCLREGYVLEETATLDEFGNWRFHIARVCADLNIEIEVALESKGPQPRLFVLEIQGDEIR
jgi:hypothetical protein